MRMYCGNVRMQLRTFSDIFSFEKYPTMTSSAFYDYWSWSSQLGEQFDVVGVAISRLGMVIEGGSFLMLLYICLRS